MHTPDIDLKELKRLKESNQKERMRFIKLYADWVKKNPNKKWSSEQRNVVVS